MKKISPGSKIKNKFISNYSIVKEKYKKLKTLNIQEIIFNNLKEKKFRFKYPTLNIKPQDWIPRIQDYVEKAFKNDTNEVILKQPRYWAQAITWALMSGSIFAIGWISIAETEEIVIALGKLEPKGGVIDVQMPLEGIARDILIKEGDKVKKDQILIRLDTEITKAQNIALNKSLEFNNTIKNKLEFLLEEGAVSELQYLQQLDSIEQIKSKIKTNLVQLKYQEIKSPADGLVFELQPKGPGYVAKSSQPVLKIVPSNNLMANVEIDNRTIGFVMTGKPVEISIDSFPASDFGAIEGVITSIGSDALPPIPSQGKGYRFPAKITLKNQFLTLKNGKKLPLQAGMSLSANIKLRKVTYLQLLLNKFGDKTKSLQSI